MSKKESRYNHICKQVEETVLQTNSKIQDLGLQASNIYQALTDIQTQFDIIRNVPSEKRAQYNKLKEIRLNWKQQAEKIEQDYSIAVGKDASAGIAGAGVGVAVVALGPTAAMGIATTFGVASTGAAISTLSGAAATNAALAWLGGGALVAGGGGMAAGNALLALAGPVGWAIAGISILSSGLLIWLNVSDHKKLEKIYTFIAERDIKSYELAIVELNERINRINNETTLLKYAIEKINLFGTDYNSMSETQQYELGSYVNLMAAATQLLVNPILGLQPKYTDEDYKNFAGNNSVGEFVSHKKLFVSLANLLYRIDLDDKEKTLLHRSMIHNKDFLKSVDITGKEFKREFLDIIEKALYFKYGSAPL